MLSLMFPVWRACRRRPEAGAVLACALALGAGLWHAAAPAQSAPAQSPQAYVGAAACAGCHPAQARDWADSHHAKSMQPATAKTVLGDFSGADPRFRRDGDAFIVRVTGADGKEADFPVAHTFGIAPLQQYLTALPGGRLQPFPFAWDARARAEGGQRWFTLPGQDVQPGDPLHWSGRNLNWNFMCADCHSTGVSKNYDARADSYDTRWSEENVACEACHGPGARHVAWARGGGGGDDGLIPLRGSDGFWGAPDARGIRQWTGAARKNPSEEVCAPCHARRRALAPAQPGAAFLDGFTPQLLDEGVYFADGQIREEAFEWGSFQQSRMRAAGVTCIDCHEPHGAKLRADGNVLCGQCHAENVFDRPEHHRHRQGSPGSNCVACHMPQRTYMGVHVRHDHSLRLPRPAREASVGAPDACTACHSDKDAAWAAAKLEGFAKRQAEAPASDIARATFLQALAQKPGAGVLQSLVPALRAPSPLVRIAALRGLAPYDEDLREKLAGPLRGDPLRAVRVEAARLTPKTDSAALDEWRAAEDLAADRPESALNLGALAAERGETAKAEEFFKRALRLDSNFAPALLDLADLYRAAGRDAEAEAPAGRARGSRILCARLRRR